MGMLGLITSILNKSQPVDQKEVNETGTYKRGRYSRQNPPNEPGAYRWINILTGVIEYAGETVDLARRTREHERSSKPLSSDTHHLEWKKANPGSTSATRREHERKKIDQHKPALNKVRGGGGRKASR